MKNIWRSIRIILEIAIACLIFFFIITKTPLFDRAIPWWNNNTNTGDTLSGNTTSREETIITTTAGEKIISEYNSGVTKIIESNGNIVYLYNWLSVSWNTFSTNTLTSWNLLDSKIYTTQEVIEVPVEQWNSCRTPRGEIIGDKDSIVSYRTQIANNTNTCYAEIRICTDGKLWWSYQYKSCNYEVDGMIILADGTKIEIKKGASNSSQQLIDLSNYLKKRDSIPDRYIQPVIVRNDTTPTLSQVKSQSMKNSTIKIKKSYNTDNLNQTIIRDSSGNRYHNSCQTPRWERVQHGNFIYAYNISQSSKDQQCISQKRACIDGKLSGSFTYKSCEIIEDPIGVVRDYNGNIVQRGTHNNNIPGSNSQNYISTTTKQSSCMTPRWQEIPHTSTIIAYRLPTSTDNSLCDKEIRSCRDGILHGSFTYQTCTEKPKNTNRRNRTWRKN